MELVNGVFEIAKEFMDKAEYVKINKNKVEKTSIFINKIKPKKVIPKKDPSQKEILIELVASSINYCYWHGKSIIRPNGSSSSYLYEIIYNSFYNYDENSIKSFESCINILIQTLSIKRFPLLEQRIVHLKQLVENNKGIKYVENIQHEENFEYYLNNLICIFPSFGSDIFLKRASLFFIEIYRKYGWFEEYMHKLHVPADYHIPRVLNDFGCIEYNPIVNEKIFNEELIPKHSKIECEIRAATILTIKQICDNTGWNVSDVDNYFFWQRNTVDKPFHLTITTDY